MNAELKKEYDLYNKGVEAAWFQVVTTELLKDPQNETALQWNNQVMRIAQNIRNLKIPIPETRTQ